MPFPFIELIHPTDLAQLTLSDGLEVNNNSDKWKALMGSSESLPESITSSSPYMPASATPHEGETIEDSGEQFEMRAQY
jgi:hypothetical protein